MYNFTKNGKTTNITKRVEDVMKLVLLFFCAIFGFLLLVSILIALSSVKLNIKRFYLSNVEAAVRKNQFDKEIVIYLEFYLLGVMKIAKVKLKRKWFKKITAKVDVGDIKKDKEVIKTFEPLVLLRKLKIKTEKLHLNLEIGTDDVILTAYVTAVISALIRGYLWNNKPEKTLFFSKAIVLFWK